MENEGCQQQEATDRRVKRSNNRRSATHLHSCLSIPLIDPTLCKMKLSIISSVLLLTAGASAFAPVSQQSRTATSLNLFGGKKGADGAPKAPGMMDQLGMLKKAQEIASKKQKLDQELKVLEFVGTGADGSIKATVVYAPGTNPMNPLPSYDLKAIDIDEAYLESASSEDLSAAVKAAIQSGEEATIKAVNEKMMVLQEDLAGMMGGMGGMQ